MLVKEEEIIYNGQEIAPGERIRFTSKEGKSITLVYEGKDYNDNAIFQTFAYKNKDYNDNVTPQKAEIEQS